MAENEPTNHQTRKLSQTELDALADRMLARAASAMFDVQPNLRSDMLLAAAVLRLVARSNPTGVSVAVWAESH